MFSPCGARDWSCSLMKFANFVGIILLLVGCAERNPVTLGPPFEGVAVPISEISQTSLTAQLIVSGTMIEKCPVAGCWFVVRDRTGTIRVDTKNAGFVVVDLPLKTTLTVSGRVATNGSERLLDATSVRY